MNGDGLMVAIKGMFMSSPNLYVEVVTPSVMVFGGGAFGR